MLNIARIVSFSSIALPLIFSCRKISEYLARLSRKMNVKMYYSSNNVHAQILGDKLFLLKFYCSFTDI